MKQAFQNWQNESRENIHFESKLMPPHAQEARYVLWSIRPERDELGHLVCFNCIGRDATQLKQTEIALAKARELAEIESHAKGRFLANLSHEIRTPMNLILGFTEVLSNKIQDSALQRYLKMIDNSGQVLLNLINDVLDISKIEAGKLSLRFEPSSLHELMEQIQGIFQEKVQAKNLQFIVEIAPQVPEAVMLDETRVRQVLMNLLSNAIKFTHQGHIRCTLQTKTVDEQHVDIIWQIEDSGIGIAPEQQNRIFQAFEQAPEHHSRTEGTGLGLAISQQLVELMGGSLTLSSVPEQGSLFQVYLPHTAIADWDSEDIVAAALPENLRFAPAKLMLVDDISHNRLLLKDYLAEQSFSFSEASSGEECLQQLQESPVLPDVILMDVRMPGMSGNKLAQILKSQTHTQNIPIIAITAAVLPEEIEGLHAYCHAVLSKPLSRANLLRHLQQLLALEED